MQLHAAIDEFVLYIEIEKILGKYGHKLWIRFTALFSLFNGPWLFNLFKRDHQDPSTSLHAISIRINKTKTMFGEPKNFFLKSLTKYCKKERDLTHDFTHGIEPPKTYDKLPVYMALTDL